MSFFGIPIRNGLPIGLGSIAGLGGARQFSPASLFAAGEQGAWYDINLTDGVLFQDSAGTTPVTAVEQPVGLMLDKSKGLVLGSELVTNGDFSGGTTGWAGFQCTLAVVSGALVATATVANDSRVVTAIPIVVGKWYQVKATIVSTSTGSVVIAYNETSGSSSFATTSTIATVAAGQSITGYVLATNVNLNLVFRSTALAIGQTFSIDNISVRELPGNHAFQSTPTSRPTLSAKVNLLTKTEQFDDAAWVKSNTTVTADATTAPDGTNTADRAIENATTNSHFVNSSGSGMAINVVSGVTYTYTIYVKKGTLATAPDWIQIAFSAGQFPSGYANFNLSTGLYGTTSNVTTVTPVSVGGGWYKIGISATATSSNSASNAIVLTFTNNNDGLGRLPSYAGSTTSDAFIWGADLRVANDGVGLPVYQRVNTATDYDTTGFPLYLRFDGSDDSFLTNSVNFTGTDKMTVWAGVRKLSDATRGMLVELSATLGGNNGTFALNAPEPPYEYTFASKGTSSGIALLDDALYVAPITNVLTGIGDISGDVATLRINAVQVATDGANQGAGNYGNYPLYIGRRDNATLPLNGRIYSLIIRGAQSTATQIAQTENYVEQKTFGKDMSNVYSDPVLTAASEEITMPDGDPIFMTVTYQ